jgi:N6-L-threonylcarbamoyladenine synthase
MTGNSQDKALTILGIETSCDETAAAIVRGSPPPPFAGPARVARDSTLEEGGFASPATSTSPSDVLRTRGGGGFGEILSNVVASQTGAHAPYGGVVPEIASRAHLEVLDGVIARAIAESGIAPESLDGIAATAGPGLIGGVMVGLTTAKGLALGLKRPLIAVNHLMGHALTGRLTSGVAFPFLLLLVSGGHCQLLGVGGLKDFRLYGSTIDDAAGEAFDKVAKLLGLPYPGGPEVERLAACGDPRAIELPRPLVTGHNVRRNADFSFSGLKTAVRLLVERGKPRPEDVCASFQSAVIDILADRTRRAMQMYERDFPGARQLVVAGGVAANRAIGAALARLCAAENYGLTVPAPALCTDNAAMIAWAGLERAAAGDTDGFSVSPRARWPLSA